MAAKIDLAMVLGQAFVGFLRQAGKTRQANTLNTLLESIKAGKNVDKQMAAVAEALKNDNYDWDGAEERIRNNSDW